MPIAGIEIPWWAYLIIAVIVIAIAYGIYKNITAYTPQQTAFNQTEPALPSNFDAAGNAKIADTDLDEWFGGDDQTLIQTLNNMSDNELIATSNAFNNQYYSEKSMSLLQRLQDIDTDRLFTDTGALRDNLVQRMQGLGIT